jgi:hypothetical protein
MTKITKRLENCYEVIICGYIFFIDGVSFVNVYCIQTRDADGSEALE